MEEGKSFWYYAGIVATAGLSLLVRYIFEKVKNYAKSDADRPKAEEPKTLGRRPIPAGHSAIHSAEITARSEILLEDNLRVKDLQDFYEALRFHVDEAKKSELESIKIEVPHYSFLNSTATTAITKIAEYVRDTNGIRLVFVISPASPQGKKLYDSLVKLNNTWETGRIEIYLKNTRGEK